MRIGLGCMRLSTDSDRDEARALETISAAIDASIRVFDTAHAYGFDDADAGHNERLIAAAIARTPRSNLRIVTKCGMRRPDQGWVPDGRARSIGDDVRASVAALGSPIDLLLLHAPDAKTSLETSLRALARALDEGHARAIGLSNVSLHKLDEARRIVPISAIEVALGAFDDAAARGGLIEYCATHGVEFFAHSPFGGPNRAPKLARDPTLRELASALGVTAPEVVLAYLLEVHPSIVPLVGARRPESVRGAVRATTIELDASALSKLDQRFPGLSRVRVPPKRPTQTEGEAVLIMGIPGAGKSRLAESYTKRGYVRLNRDTLGGTLRDVVKELEARLQSGDRNFVLDNTYTTRALRSDVVSAVHRHSVAARCIFVDTPIEQAQINAVLRMLEKCGTLLDPAALRRRVRQDPNLVSPTTLFRMLRELEPPGPDEGFEAIETVAFERAPDTSADHAAAAIALDAVLAESDAGLSLRSDAVERLVGSAGPCLVFGWKPGAGVEWMESATRIVAELAEATNRVTELAVCTHPAGPPICWCRPPLPGLWLDFARRHRIDAQKSVVLGGSEAHRVLARAIGAVFNH